MSPCHCQCSPDHHTVLQSKIHANDPKTESTSICMQGLIGQRMSLVVINLIDPIHACTYNYALVAL